MRIISEYRDSVKYPRKTPKANLINGIQDIILHRYPVTQYFFHTFFW